MNITDKIIEAQKMPKTYFRDNIDKITYSDNDDLEDIIPLLTVTAYIDEPEVFTNLIKLMADFMKRSIEPIYEYYYYLALASYSKHTFDYVTAIDYCMKSNHIAYDLKDVRFIVESLRFMSSIYQSNNDSEMALYYCEGAIKELVKCDSLELKSSVYMLYGVVLVALKDYKHALEAYTKALTVIEMIDDHERHANYYLLMVNIGEVYMLLGDIKKAESYYNDGAKIAEQYNHEYTFSDLLLMLADFYKSVDDHRKSSYYYEKFAKKRKTKQIDVNLLDDNRDKNDLKSQMSTMKNLREKNDILLKRVMQLHDELNHDKQFLIKNQILEEDLLKGLEKNEIVAFYQLKWSTTKERPIGAEALIRWMKDGSIVPPGMFISEIEESSIIIDVSKRVISDSMKVCKILVDEYDPEFVMSVNIAPYQLNHQKLSKFIEGELILNKLPAKNFEIEITERSFIDSNPRITEELYAIKELGVSIALDDFGTGYSSLSCINDLPINSVKIDRSLIMNSETDIKTALLLNGIIALMNNLQMEIVIEGVEHKNQVDLLKSYNCDYLQGYYFSKPIKEEDFIGSMMSYIK